MKLYSARVNHKNRTVSLITFGESAKPIPLAPILNSLEARATTTDIDDDEIVCQAIRNQAWSIAKIEGDAYPVTEPNGLKLYLFVPAQRPSVLLHERHILPYGCR